jgi:trk system potassium uptake protein TrkA
MKKGSIKAQVAVIGLGRFGFHAAQSLFEHGHEVLAIDNDRAMVQKIKDHCSQAVVMDARDKDRLRALGLKNFDVVVVSLGERVDASALVVLHLRELGVRRIITKAGSEDHAKLLELIGAHEIIFPERQAAERLARRLTDVNILDYISLGGSYSIQELAPPDAFVGKSLKELDLRNRYNVQVLAVRDALTDDLQVNPAPDLIFKGSEVLVLLGSNQDLDRLRRL